MVRFTREHINVVLQLAGILPFWILLILEVFSNIVTERANNSADISEIVVKGLKEEDPCSFIIEISSDKKRAYSLKANTKEEAEHWMKTLTEV